jgi:hypothetical protein
MNSRPNLPIDQVFMPNITRPGYKELKYRPRVFTSEDIELIDQDRYYLCVYCRDRLPADYEPWDKVYRLCSWCEPWYRHCFQALDQRWIDTAWRNLPQRIKRVSYRKQGVQVLISEYDFRFLMQTLLVPFRFYYPYERPSVDRHRTSSSEWPHYSWSTIALAPHSLNCLLRSSCLTLNELVAICDALREPPFYGQQTIIKRQTGKSNRCISEIATGKRYKCLRKYDARILELFREEPGETPSPTMWNWEYEVNPDMFHEDREEHDAQLQTVLRQLAYRAKKLAEK